MYVEHFGLAKNPFLSIADGEAVFEGPEQAKIISGLKTALMARDSIAVLTGPVGVGKTTIVQRALEEMGPERLVASLGRTQVDSEELVELLLAQFGVVREPTRRFECIKTFNRILNERAAAGNRVFIVIEDAERLGADSIEELEALTAADGGAAAGANIILMGPQKLDKLIAAPTLERVRQRIRLQQELQRFTAEDVEIYLRHRIKAAGGDFDAMFEPGAALMVRRCSGGIPRVINGLCETALTVAASNQSLQLGPRDIFKVAVEVFGMSPGDAPPPPATSARKAAKPEAPAAKAPEPEAEQAPAAGQATAEAKKPEPPAKQPQAPQAKPAPAAEEPKPVSEANTESTDPVQKVPAPPTVTPEPRPSSTPPMTRPEAKKLPDIKGLGVQDRPPAAPQAKSEPSKPLPELPPKFKFADEIVVDKDTKPNLPPLPEKVIPPELPTQDFEDDAPKVVDEVPDVEKAPVTPPARTDDIPTLGDSARVEKMSPPAPQTAADAPKPAPQASKPVRESAKPAAPAKKPLPEAPKPAPEASKPADSDTQTFEEPNPPADRSDPKLQVPPGKRLEPDVKDPTATFAKVDHDMLDAALASLAVHDDADQAAEAAEVEDNSNEAPAAIPEVTLDKSLQAARPAPKPVPDLDKMAAELEKTQSLEEMSDQLAETLFGCEELEQISLQIREKVAESNGAAADAANGGDAASPPAPEAPPATPQPAAPGAAVPPQDAGPRAPSAAQPAAPSKPADNVEMSAEKPAQAELPPKRGPQPEPIENQFNTSMTATLKTLSAHAPSASDGDSEEDEDGSEGLLGRLKDTFKN